MSTDWDIIGRDSVVFFGKMSASISHEIKNVLAIINENAGLLGDYTLMAEKGMPIEPERLKKVSEKIMLQVKRADHIVKNMNTFAHSVDEPIQTVDLNALLATVLKLSERFASNRGLSLEQLEKNNPISITTSPFLLENLLWHCLDYAMTATGEKKKVQVIAEVVQNGVVIRYQQLSRLEEHPVKSFPEKEEKALLAGIGGTLNIDSKNEELTLHLPKTIKQ